MSSAIPLLARRIPSAQGPGAAWVSCTYLLCSLQVLEKLLTKEPCEGRKFAALELKIIITLFVWNFALESTPTDLSSMSAQDLMAHTPQQCYVRLAQPA